MSATARLYVISFYVISCYGTFRIYKGWERRVWRKYLTKSDLMISFTVFIVGSKSCIKRAAKEELNPYERGIY